ncbi:ESX-1 secretion-associated protein EspF [Mycobacterium kansasii 824]|uniref:ESX-1 secretion-associated protein EspF n=1 Tax=Mycobacterium kansasii TaxID=1768 RepID=A0A1V3XS45_MYCKA|nr:ESX-1 secretion-associated protein EspF [Mycobacterium kansasii 824]OOK81900.1 ESX-1 secretion-associated protein EspF [Mycobacterium kansasii]OOK84205.1 ESX-1 secretion-associated protein EspF [Mycobacterium kansasii]
MQLLAGSQDNLAIDIKAATQSVDGISEAVSTTHGSLTSTFNITLAKLVTIRSFTGMGLEKLTTDVATNLRIAAHAYRDTDSDWADLIEKFRFRS